MLCQELVLVWSAGLMYHDLHWNFPIMSGRGSGSLDAHREDWAVIADEVSNSNRTSHTTGEADVS